jgi:hypothetical protein
VTTFTPVIEKGIPIPPAGVRKGKEYAKYNLKRLEIGDSFLAPTRRVAGLYSYAKQNALKLIMRRCDDYNVRVWRVE